MTKQNSQLIKAAEHEMFKHTDYICSVCTETLTLTISDLVKETQAQNSCPNLIKVSETFPGSYIINASGIPVLTIKMPQ